LQCAVCDRKSAEKISLADGGRGGVLLLLLFNITCLHCCCCCCCSFFQPLVQLNNSRFKRRNLNLCFAVANSNQSSELGLRFSNRPLCSRSVITCDTLEINETLEESHT
jgi:hypothetical protein